MSRKIRVLVVDDSAFARKVVREILAGDDDIDVVATAHDGLDALERIAELKPDVVTLDLVMPNLDGLGVLKALPAIDPPRVIVVSMADEESELGVGALQNGAFDLVHKPTALAVARLYEIGDELREKVRAAAAVRARPTFDRISSPAIVTPRATRARVLVIGASTGGPQALTHLLTRLPRDFPIPVAVVLHMPLGYTEALARRLDGECAVTVREAEAGGTIEAGEVIIARAGVHMRLARRDQALITLLDVRPLDTLHRPSVDVLFTSAAEVAGAGALGVVLTGMGEDGLAGARALHAVGARTLTEDASTCVVYGMPRAIVEAGLSHESAPLPRMFEAIARNL